MSETYSVYNKNGTLANELAQCRVIKISSGVYTWDIVGGSAASTSEESIVADDNYSVICAEISGAERAGVPIEWAVNSAKDFYIVAVCGGGIIDGVSDGAFSYDAIKKVLWLECPFENAETWQAYIFRSEKPVNNFAIAEGRARISAIQAQFEKDNRVMRQIIAERFRTLRTPDTIKTLPPKEIRAGKVLAFGEDGNPDLSLAKEDVSGAYAARDEAKELKNQTETLKNETAELKSDTERYKNYAIDAAKKAVSAQEKAEEAEENTQILKSSVEATVSEFNSTVNAKVQEVESAVQSGTTAVNSAKTAAVGEISGIKAEVESAGQSAQTEIQAETEAAKAVIDGWTEQTSRLAKTENAISLLQADKANRGYLQFNKAKLTIATNNATSLPLTLCLTYDCDDWSAVVGKGFGSGVAFFNTERVDWSNEMHYGFNFGIYSGSGNANEIHLVVRSANNVPKKVANNYISFNKATGKHTICVSISEVADFAVRFYQDGAFLGVRTSTGGSTSMLDEVGGSSTGIHIASMANYATVGGQTAIPNLKLSRLKIFNCVLPATKADDVNGIGYTIEDYNNGVDEPPTMQDTSATYRALLSLQDYVFNGEVLDASGNGNHASITVSDGGSVRGTNDNAVETLYQKIAARISNNS